MTALTKTDKNLLYKLNNLNGKTSRIDWSLDEFARRWGVAKKTLVAFFRKIKILGYLHEHRIHYHEVLRSLTNEGIEAVKSGVYSVKKLFEEKPKGNRSETDTYPLRTCRKSMKSSDVQNHKNHPYITNNLNMNNNTIRLLSGLGLKDKEIQSIMKNPTEHVKQAVTYCTNYVKTFTTGIGAAINYYAKNPLTCFENLMSKEKRATPLKKKAWTTAIGQILTETAPRDAWRFGYTDTAISFQTPSGVKETAFFEDSILSWLSDCFKETKMPEKELILAICEKMKI